MVPLTPQEGMCLVDLATAPDPRASILTGKGVLVRTELTEAFNTWALTSLVFQAEARNYATSVLLPIMQQAAPIVWFRLGTSAGGAEQWRPWEPHWLTYYAPLSRNDGSASRVLIQTADLLFALHRSEKIAPWQGLVSDMVKKIGAANFPGVQMLCEPTHPALTLYQSVLTDWDFVCERLRPRSLNAAGHGAFKIYARATYQGQPRIVYATADYNQIGATTWDVSQTINNAIGQINFADRTKIRAMGRAGAATIPVNPYTSQAQPGTSNPQSALRLGDVPYVAPPNETVSLRYHQSDVNPPEELLALAQNRYADQRLDAYHVEFSMVQSPLMRVGDFLNVTTSNDTAWNGLYVVAMLRHVVKGGQGALLTTVTGIRGETVQSGGAPTTQPVSNPQTATPPATVAAPGNPPSAGSVDTGPAPATPPTAPVVTVSDPNTGDDLPTGDGGDLGAGTLTGGIVTPYKRH